MAEDVGCKCDKSEREHEKAIDDVRCVFSGVQGGRARAGVIVLLSERVGRCLKKWNGVNERILRLRLNVEGTVCGSQYVCTNR